MSLDGIDGATRKFRYPSSQVINDRGHVLQCSHYMPLPMPEGRALPCVIYCHGNSGCRADASEAVVILLSSYITVFTLDFSGSGLSEGEHVTLGWKEKDDLKAVVAFLRADEHISCIGLWGRSMGAVTSFFAVYTGQLLEVKVAVQYMRKVIQKKAHFDIMDLDVVQGDKNIIKFEGDHNSPRPQFYYDSISIFFHNVLHPPDDLIEEHASESMYEYLDGLENLDENVWHDIMSAQGFTPNSTVTAPHQRIEFSADSTEDAINHSRSKWQMSRTEVPVGLADDSDKIVDFLQAEDFDGCEMLPSSSYGLERRENGCNVEDSSHKSHDNSETSSEHRCLDTAAAIHTNNQVVDYSLDTFAQFPRTTEDEEKMVMEAITASLRDLEIEQVYQNQTSKSTENYSHQKNPEAPFPDTPQGSDKELVQAATCTEVNTSY